MKCNLFCLGFLLLASVHAFVIDEEDKHEDPLSVNDSLSKAEAWINSQTCSAPNTKDQRHRIIIALALGNEEFFRERCQMVTKDLDIQLLVKLKNFQRDPLSAGQVALYILAKVASCSDPRDFYGEDLVQLMQEIQQATDNASSSARNRFSEGLEALAACASGASEPAVVSKIFDNLAHLTGISSWSDSLSMNLLASRCLLEDFPNNINESTIIREALDKLVSTQNFDGSFGNIYTSALAVQALKAYGDDSGEWDQEAAEEYLLRQQKKDGSFGDVLATYFTVPALSGRTLALLRNYKCSGEDGDTVSPNASTPTADHGNEVSVWYSLWKDDNATDRLSITLSVPQESAMLAVMLKAASVDDRFRFEYKNSDFGAFVTSIAGIENNSAENRYWLVYEVDYESGLAEQAQTGVSSLKVRNNGHYVMWYKKVEFI